MAKDNSNKQQKPNLPKLKPQFGQKKSQFSVERDIEPTAARGTSKATTAFKTQHKG